MRLASIDVGSNTVRFLVADVEGSGPWRVVEQDQVVTRLGEGLARDGRLGEGPMARTTEAVRRYALRAAALGAHEVRIVATSAAREAANARTFAHAVEAATGRPLRVVSGEEEARLTLAGIRAGLGRLPDTALAFDIGGGSTEFILARRGRLAQAASLRLGVVPLAERHPFPGPVAWTRYRALVDEVREQLARELPAAIRDVQIEWLVGTAGTVTTLAALDLGLDRYDAARVQGHVLTRGAVEAVLARLGALDVAGRGALPCMEPGRADLIVPGVAIVTATLDTVGVDRLVVSDWGLREGILAATGEPC